MYVNKLVFPGKDLPGNTQVLITNWHNYASHGQLIFKYTSYIEPTALSDQLACHVSVYLDDNYILGYAHILMAATGREYKIKIRAGESLVLPIIKNAIRSNPFRVASFNTYCRRQDNPDMDDRTKDKYCGPFLRFNESKL